MHIHTRALIIAAIISMSPAMASASALPGFAVVELFTSEGCSSCPPADEAVSRVSTAAAQMQKPLYVLEWHVDYWDYLGWKDPFSSGLATSRQRAYARALGSSLYTPQAILNGYRVPAWAGDQGEVEAAARQLMSARPTGSGFLALTASAEGGSVRVHAEVRDAPRASTLLVALVEEGLSSNPTAGENKGRKLFHSNVVRGAVTLPSAGGDTVMQIPPGVDMGKSHLVGLLQDSTTMKIWLAAKAIIGVAASQAGRMTGRVVDPAGKGIAAVNVKACSDTLCIPAATDRDGFFSLEGLPAGSYTVSLDGEAPFGRFAMTRGASLALGSIRKFPAPPSG